MVNLLYIYKNTRIMSLDCKLSQIERATENIDVTINTIEKVLTSLAITMLDIEKRLDRIENKLNDNI